MSTADNSQSSCWQTADWVVLEIDIPKTCAIAYPSFENQDRIHR